MSCKPLKRLFIVNLINILFLASLLFARVKPGIEALLQESDILQGKRIGLITNPSGVTCRFQSTVDALFQQPQLRLSVLFGPEHGVRGDHTAGEKVENAIDPFTRLPVYSLYGSSKKPTPEMLQGVDVLVFDIQDVGVRHYTYIYSMALAMQAAAELHIPFVILDRPNPLGGDQVDGPVLDVAFKSFIGLYPIPLVHGMTIGELGRLFNEAFAIHAQLTVIPMQGWDRSMNFSDTGLPWIPTSPHIPHWTTPFFYAATGAMGELQSVSCGVGYTMPFEVAAAPWIDAKQLSDELNQLKLPGVFFRPVTLKPFYSLYQNEKINGVQIHLTDLTQFRPVATQICILSAIRRLYPEQPLLNPRRFDMFDKAMGTDVIRKQLEAGMPPEQIIDGWQEGLNAFKEIRKKYLLY